MLIIPAIDIVDGRVVRLSKGDFNNPTFYDIDLIEQIKLYQVNGFNLIHVVDLKASKENVISTHEILKRIKKETTAKIQFGGGIRNINDVEFLFNLGIDRLIIGSMSINNRAEFEKILLKFNSELIVVAIDVLKENVMIKGWTEDSNINVFDHIRYCYDLGVKKYLCTDIDKDGMLQGINNQLYNKISKRITGIDLIASGGVSKLDDIQELKVIGIKEVVVGKAIYENKISIEELKKIAN